MAKTKIHRYLKEYANARKREFMSLYRQFHNPAALDMISDIERMMKYCERGLCTEDETIRWISKIERED